MRTVRNVLTDEVREFYDCVSARHALAYVYFEERNELGWFFNHQPNYEAAYKHLKFDEGRWFIGLGDWATRKDTEDENHDRPNQLHPRDC